MSAASPGSQDGAYGAAEMINGRMFSGYRASSV
jgi:hypothetical protein